jgi:hypothetical protein
MGFLNILTLIFVAARLFDFIDWSWWLVLAPSIVNLFMVIFVLAGALFIASKD